MQTPLDTIRTNQSDQQPELRASPTSLPATRQPDAPPAIAQPEPLRYHRQNLRPPSSKRLLSQALSNGHCL